jgi:hypothetical protein
VSQDSRVANFDKEYYGMDYYMESYKIAGDDYKKIMTAAGGENWPLRMGDSTARDPDAVDTGAPPYKTGMVEVALPSEFKDGDSESWWCGGSCSADTPL